MSDDQLDKIRDLIKEEVRPLKDMVELVKQKVDTNALFKDSEASNIRLIKDQQSLMNEKFDGMKETLEDVKETLDSNTASVVEIESTLKAYGDMYKVNQDNDRKLEKRIGSLEEKAGINPDPDLILMELP